MKTYLLLFNLIAFTFILFPSVTCAQAVRNSIGGHVFDTQRKPVGEVYVELQNEVYSTIERTKTDSSGRYFFNRLSAGRFSVRVLPYGTNLEEQTQEVEIVNFVAPGSNTTEYAQKDFYLRVRRDVNEADATARAIFVQDVPAEAQKSYKQAVAYIEDKKIETGIDKLRNAIKAFPDYYIALEKLGNELIKQQKFQEAQEIYKRAVAVNSRSFIGWYGLSYASYGLKQAENAMEAAQKAVSLNSSSADALLMLGISQRQAKLYDDAEKSLKRANKSAKNQSSDIHWNLALLYAHNFKRYKAAADELKLYLKNEPDTDIVHREKVEKLIKQYREMPDL